MPERFIKFRSFTVDRKRFLMWDGGNELKARKKDVRILVRLIESQGNVVRATDVPELNVYRHDEELQRKYFRQSISRLWSLNDTLKDCIVGTPKRYDEANEGGYEFVEKGIQFEYEINPVDISLKKPTRTALITPSTEEWQGTDKVELRSFDTPMAREKKLFSDSTSWSAIVFQEPDSLFTIAEAEEAVLSSETLYEYPGGRVGAICLYGAAEQCLAPEQIKIRYEDSPFPIPEALKVRGEDRIREQIKRRDRGEIEFFDGPCARLLNWVKPSFESFAQDGRPYLELVVGPIGWYDVERTNAVLRQDLLEGQKINYEHWIGLSALAHRGDIRGSKLTNIVGNAITIFTKDGQVGYQHRGDQQSMGSNQLSSVAENLQRYFDDTKPGNPFDVFHRLPPGMKLSEGPDNEECPPLKGVLHPAAAVRRGVALEASYKMADRIPDGGVKCTGLCFSLDALQPDLLWIVLVNLTAEKFKEKCRTERPKEWREGRIRFVPADFMNPETQRVLARPDWIAGGKASLVRAIELIDVLSYQKRIPVTKVFEDIKTHTSL